MNKNYLSKQQIEPLKISLWTFWVAERCWKIKENLGPKEEAILDLSVTITGDDVALIGVNKDPVSSSNDFQNSLNNIQMLHPANQKNSFLLSLSALNNSFLIS